MPLVHSIKRSIASSFQLSAFEATESEVFYSDWTGRRYINIGHIQLINYQYTLTSTKRTNMVAGKVDPATNQQLESHVIWVCAFFFTHFQLNCASNLPISLDCEIIETYVRGLILCMFKRDRFYASKSVDAVWSMLYNWYAWVRTSHVFHGGGSIILTWDEYMLQ